MTRLRVCQLISSLESFSAQRCVHELARRLDPERFEVDVLSLTDGPEHGWLIESGVRVSLLGLQGFSLVTGLTRLAGILRERGYDLVHTHLPAADLLGRLAMRLASGGGLIHSVHVAELRRSPWWLAYARLLRGSCHRVVCASEAARAEYARRTRLPVESCQVIPHGVDAARLARDPRRRGALRGRWGIGEDEVVFAFAGRLDEHSGVEHVLAAASHLAARGHPVVLLFAGEGPLEFVVRNFIRHGEGGRRCRHLGPVADLGGVLSAADVLILADEVESSPVAAAEAMAASLALIVSDVPGVHEVAREGGSGLIVQPGDREGLAEAIRRLAVDADLRRRLGEAGRQAVCHHYGVDAFIQAHERLYEDVARQAPRKPRAGR